MFLLELLRDTLGLFVLFVFSVCLLKEKLKSIFGYICVKGIVMSITFIGNVKENMGSVLNKIITEICMSEKKNYECHFNTEFSN